MCVWNESFNKPQVIFIMVTIIRGSTLGVELFLNRSWVFFTLKVNNLFYFFALLSLSVASGCFPLLNQFCYFLHDCILYCPVIFLVSI